MAGSALVEELLSFVSSPVLVSAASITCLMAPLGQVVPLSQRNTPWIWMGSSHPRDGLQGPCSSPCVSDLVPRQDQLNVTSTRVPAVVHSVSGSIPRLGLMCLSSELLEESLPVQSIQPELA